MGSEMCIRDRTDRQGTAQRVATALRGSKPGTARPTTTSGRFVRLGTASLASQPGGPFIDIHKLNMDKYAKRAHLARVLCDYILYSEHNAKIAANLCQAVLVRLWKIQSCVQPAGTL